MIIQKKYVDVKQYSLGEVAYHRFIQFLQFGKQVYICSYHWKNNKWYLNTIEYLDKIKQGPFPPTLNSSGQSYYSFDESLLTEYKL